MTKLLCTLALALCFATPGFAADPASPGASDPKMAEMMAKMKEYGTPGAAHKVLADMTGEWTFTNKWWENANAKPQESKGTSSMRLVLGGRWLQQDVKGEMMGQPFEGLGMVGYDNLEKQYNTLWFDSMGTGVMHGHGTFNAKTKTLSDKGEFSCPVENDKKRNYRSDWQIKDKNTMIYTMYGPNPNETKEYKQMEITYKRKM